MADTNREHRERVAHLSDLDDFEVADHDPDVRGWDVISADGRKIGEVEDLIVDTGAMKVRYLDVEVEKDYRADNDNRRILIPVGQARLHVDEDHVHVSSLSSTDVRTFPSHDGRFDRSYEDTVHTRFGSGNAGAAGGTDKDYYSHANFDDDRFYGKRRGTGTSRNMSGRRRESTDRLRTDREDRRPLSDEGKGTDRR
jgi:photosynthetic reaction center H subunit